MANQPTPNSPQPPNVHGQPNPAANQPAGQAVPPPPQHQKLVAAGAPHSAAQQLTGMGLTDEQVNGVAQLAAIGGFNWGELLRLVTTYGPQVVQMILALFSKTPNPPAPVP